MASRVIKNYQINIGAPYKVNVPTTVQQHTNVETHNMDNNSLEEVSELQANNIIEETRKKAKELIDYSQEEAIRIIRDAKKEAIEVKNNAEKVASQEGYQKGLQKGYEDARIEHENLIKEVETLRQKTLQDYKEHIVSVENDIIDMVMEISRKVIHDKVLIDKDEVLEMVKQSIEKCSNKEQITIRVSFDDYNYVYENRDKLISAIDGLEKIKIVKEESLETGSCLIESSYGTLDASINTKLKRIEDAFNNILND